jgi:hypothetical protein
MNGETKMGLGLVAAMALCCGGPLILSALASGVVLGSLGAVWDGGRLPELAATRQHIREFQSMHTAALAGRSELAIFASDPCRMRSQRAC